MTNLGTRLEALYVSVLGELTLRKVTLQLKEMNLDPEDLQQQIYLYILEEQPNFQDMGTGDAAALVHTVADKVTAWLSAESANRAHMEDEDAESCINYEDPEKTMIRESVREELVKLLSNYPKRDQIVMIQMSGLDDGVPDDVASLGQYLASIGMPVAPDELNRTVKRCLISLRHLSQRGGHEFKYYYPL